MVNYKPSNDVFQGNYSTTKERRKIILNVIMYYLMDMDNDGQWSFLGRDS